MQLELFPLDYTVEELTNLELVLEALVEQNEVCHNCKVCPSDGQRYCTHCVEAIADYLYLADLERNAVEVVYQYQFSL